MKKLLIGILALSSLTAFAKSSEQPCGLQGSVDERIKDCSYQSHGFVLVTRSESLNEVYKETDTGLLWGDRLSNKMVLYSAQDACSEKLKGVAGITGVTWRLPLITEFNHARDNGIIEALPNMNQTFWAMDPIYGAWMFYGDAQGRSGFSGTNDYQFDASVRCVAKL